MMVAMVDGAGRRSTGEATIEWLSNTQWSRSDVQLTNPSRCHKFMDGKNEL